MSDQTGPSELEFFGEVTAAITHDINNRLAVINENAGLLEDYVHMYRNGREMDPEKLGRVAENVKRNVSRAHEIVKTLNRFAHAVDKPVEQVDLQDTLTLSSLLSGRVLQKNDVSLNVDTTGDTVTINTSRYHLLILIWVCIKTAAGNAAPGGALSLTCGKSGDDAHISIRMSTATGTGKRLKLPGYAENLAHQIGLSVDENQADDTIVIHCRQ